MHRPGGVTNRRTFAVAALAVAAASVAFAAVLELRPWGAGVTTAVDDIGEAVAATVAAGTCAWAARRTVGRLRIAWVLLAGSAASWAAGEVVWSVYEVGLGVDVPFPSPADAGFLLAVPLAIAGVLAFSSSPRGTSTSWRIWIDGLIIGLSLLFIAWSSGLNAVLTSGSGPEDAISAAYPIGDILVGTVLILMLRRATAQQQGRMLLLLGGLGANAIADSAFSYLTASGAYGVLGSVLDTGWFAGYLMIALAALWPSARADVVLERDPIDVWQLALPWTVIAAASVAGLVRIARGIPLDLFLSLDVAVIGFLIMLSQVEAHRDSLRMLLKARASEATLAEVIARAPAGVIRIATDMTIIDANPRFVALMQTGNPRGRSVKAFFSEAAGERMAAGMSTLGLAVDAVEDDADARRADGTNVWVHWSATAVPNSRGENEYYIAMFEDTTARHEAEEAAARSLELVQRLNALKTEFLHTVSHEFKTALIGIQGFSELMRDADELDVNDARTFAADIHRDAERLDRMVTEMVELDRVETAHSSLRFDPVDVNELVRREVEETSRGLDGVRVAAELEPSLPLARGDEEKLRAVARALLDNAVRHSPDGGTITVLTGLAGDAVTVTVRDQGSGARDDFDNRLFAGDDVYANNPIRKVIGTGLGMGIVRHVVELHGGRLWVERTEAGNEFRFTLRPYKEPAPPLASVQVA
jgi:PAS domain S-box-containing protein